MHCTGHLDRCIISTAKSAHRDVARAQLLGQPPAQVRDGQLSRITLTQQVPALQVFGAARQMLSLVAGGAIDEWLLSNLRTLRQEHALARVLAHLQAQLWPGGTWFQSLPEYQSKVFPWAPALSGAVRSRSLGLRAMAEA